MKTVELAFITGDTVWIKELECDGYVESVAIGWRGPEYKISYWSNAERKEAWLRAVDLGEK